MSKCLNLDTKNESANIEYIKTSEDDAKSGTSGDDEEPQLPHNLNIKQEHEEWNWLEIQSHAVDIKDEKVGFMDVGMGEYNKKEPPIYKDIKVEVDNVTSTTFEDISMNEETDVPHNVNEEGDTPCNLNATTEQGQDKEIQLDDNSFFSVEWTKELTGLLIDQYEQHECLWSTKQQCTKFIRKEAYGKIAAELKKKCKEITVTVIKKKINNLRTQFAREKNKVLESRSRSGVGAHYYPGLWWFRKMSFLNDNTLLKKGTSNTSTTSISLQEEIPKQETGVVIGKRIQVLGHLPIIPLQKEIPKQEAGGVMGNRSQVILRPRPTVPYLFTHSTLLPGSSRSSTETLIEPPRKKQKVVNDVIPESARLNNISQVQKVVNNLIPESARLNDISQAQKVVNNLISESARLNNIPRVQKVVNNLIPESARLNNISQVQKEKDADEVFGELISMELKQIKDEKTRLDIKCKLYSYLCGLIIEST